MLLRVAKNLTRAQETHTPRAYLRRMVVNETMRRPRTRFDLVADVPERGAVDPGFAGFAARAETERLLATPCAGEDHQRHHQVSVPTQPLRTSDAGRRFHASEWTTASQVRPMIGTTAHDTWMATVVSTSPTRRTPITCTWVSTGNEPS